MKKLEKIILDHGEVYGKDILKVDSFLNHQIKPKLIQEMAEEFAEHFKDKNINKILTVESSGIAPALLTGLILDCDVVFARKQKSLTTDENTYSSTCYSYTKEEMKRLIVSKNFLGEGDRVLLIDDFLANGQAAKAMVAICKQAGASVGGIGIVIEKSYQDGRKLLDDMGIDVYSLARISHMDGKEIDFID